MRRSTVQNSSVMDAPTVNVPGSEAEAAYTVRGGILFTQAAIVLLAGLLLPIPPIAIDVLLAINFVFTIMLFFVVLMAREPAQITSVPLVVVFITLLRLGTNVAAAKSIILIVNGGRIIDWCGTRVYYGFISIIVAAMLVFLICALIFKAATFIRLKAISYLVETIPQRQTSLEAEIRKGAINHDQALRVKSHIDKQIRFFGGMTSTSSLLLCDGVITLIVTIATIIGATVLGIMNASTIMTGSHQYYALAAAFAVTTTLPAAFVALALRLLINKRFLIMLKVQSPSSQKMYVPSIVVDSKPDKKKTADISQSSENMSHNEPVSKKSMAVTITEFAEETQEVFEQKIGDTVRAVIAPKKEAQVEAKFVSPLPGTTIVKAAVETTEEMHDSGIFVESEQVVLPQQIVRNDDYYDNILATVGDKEKAVILLVSQSIAYLPVTIAVELVINIIKLRKKCLLIDMDPTRNAVATAFDIDSTLMQGKAVPTGIENLWISPADDPDSSVAIKLSRKVANALKVFDYVVIYLPNFSTETMQQFVDISGSAVIFGVDEASSFEQLPKTLVDRGFRITSEQNLLKKGFSSQQ
jgi:hypothetical protein